MISLNEMSILHLHQFAQIDSMNNQWDNVSLYLSLYFEKRMAGEPEPFVGCDKMAKDLISSSLVSGSVWRKLALKLGRQLVHGDQNVDELLNEMKLADCFVKTTEINYENFVHLKLKNND